MKRKIVFAFILFLTALSALIGAGCTKSVLPKPETNLEFWIAENVDGVDFSAYTEKVGMFGGQRFYGTGYYPTVKDGEQTDPERCVLYTITKYPDYSDKEQCVTHIFITDPEIEFYGITLNSSFAEFEQKVKTRGFKITQSDEACRVAVNGGFSITFTKESISINAAITNKHGLIF